MRKKLQSKYMVMETRKDGTKFTNRPLKEAAERLQNLSGQYDDMQKQLVEQVTARTHGHMSRVPSPVHITASKDGNSTDQRCSLCNLLLLCSKLAATCTCAQRTVACVQCISYSSVYSTGIQ